MKKNNLFLGVLCCIYSLFPLLVQASSTPLFVFSPLTPTTFQLPISSTAFVQYTITNMSTKTHTLKMLPITGINQIMTPGNCANAFTLGAKQSCTLTLQINGSQISSYVVGGPQVCQLGPNGNPNPLQCYQPSMANSLHITATSAISLLYVGTQNGQVYYSPDNGVSWVATTIPAGGSAINSVFATNSTLYAGAANGIIYASQNNGISWSPQLNPAPGFAVNGLYSFANILYVASANGSVLLCSPKPGTCTPTNAPAPSFAVNGVFATENSLYAASANGNVYYSNNYGLNWTAINGQPDGSAVKTVYVSANTIYVSTANEFVYATTALTGGGSWSPFAQTVYSFFISSYGNQSFAGSQIGYVYSLTFGTRLGFVANTLINTVFLLT
ncbi:WD40/YVTN/BNR-like repeat-containing protein [Legionella saoudiensis]|uniref:WD40/YVTN/BNR-like repeat-containing protein n=1 Tax=Legionella saoudiensis TaxID=1750561 RepID=UPI000731AF0B|nr:hypothetical protein [Legionella saoudiensis]